MACGSGGYAPHSREVATRFYEALPPVQQDLLFEQGFSVRTDAYQQAAWLRARDRYYGAADRVHAKLKEQQGAAGRAATAVRYVEDGMAVTKGRPAPVGDDFDRVGCLRPAGEPVEVRQAETVPSGDGRTKAPRPDFWRRT